MPAETKFHGRAQAAYDHFSKYRDKQQESSEEALMVVRGAHHQVLVAAAMLEGHIEWLHHSISQGGTGVGGDWAVTRGQEAEDAQDVEAIQGAIEGLRWLDPKHSLPQWKATLGELPRDGQIHPSPIQPRRQGESAEMGRFTLPSGLHGAG